MARLLLGIWIALSALPELVWGLDLASLNPTGHVNDFAGVIDVETKAEIENYCRRVKEGTGAEIAIVLLTTLDGEPIEDVANSLFRRWGIGSKDKKEGVLFLIAVRDRKTRLEVGYGLEGVIPDGLAGDMLRSLRPQLRASNYGAAMAGVAQTLGERIAREKGVTIPGTLTRRRGPVSNEGIPLPVILLGIVLLLMLFGGMGGGGGRRRRGSRRPGQAGLHPLLL